MTDTPLVSFIVYVCDTSPDMLRGCVESILSLSLSANEREVIVVDDGSDIYTLQGIAEYADKLIYIRQGRQGRSVARNMALRMATGRFVQFVDGGSCLLRAPYEHCLDIARYHNPDIVLFKRTADKSKATTPFAYSGPMSGSDFMRCNTLCTAYCGYLFERSILGSLRFRTDSLVEEEEFVPQLFLRSDRLYTTDSYAYLQRGHSDGNRTEEAGGDDERVFADTERTLLRLRSIVVPEADRIALNRRIAQLTMEYLCDIIRRTRDIRRLDAAIDRLRASGLYPLPDRDYTKRYRYFRRLIGNPLTKRLLFVLIR